MSFFNDSLMFLPKKLSNITFIHQMSKKQNFIKVCCTLRLESSQLLAWNHATSHCFSGKVSILILVFPFKHPTHIHPPSPQDYIYYKRITPHHSSNSPVNIKNLNSKCPLGTLKVKHSNPFIRQYITNLLYN